MPFKEMKNIHMFDCDGVILDSNDLKVIALKAALESVGSPIEFVMWAIAEFRKNFGRTRMRHFKFFSENHKVPNFNFCNDLSSRAMVSYGTHVRELYRHCDTIDETYQYIELLPRDDLIFVVSASDQAELREVLPSRIPRIIEPNILGGPVNKSENIRSILKCHGSGGAVFYGDSVKDGFAAAENSIDFIGLTKYSTSSDALRSYCAEVHADCFDHCLQVSS